MTISTAPPLSTDDAMKINEKKNAGFRRTPQQMAQPKWTDHKSTNREAHHRRRNGDKPASSPVAARRERGKLTSSLPTLPLEVGWREVQDPLTAKIIRQPLTLSDLLCVKEEEIGVVVMPQGPIHDYLSREFADTLQPYLASEGWLVLHDVQIHWNVGIVPPRYPDIALIAGGQLPEEGNETYHVGRDGPLPSFIIEITSESTRPTDLSDKPTIYASVGVPEFLIVDRGTPLSEPWLLRGYRLGDGPTYEAFFADENGRISFEGIGLQFEVVGRDHVNIYDLATGERWLIPTEQRERAEAEAEARAQADARAEQANALAEQATARAEQERQRADEATARAEQYAAQLRALGLLAE